VAFHAAVEFSLTTPAVGILAAVVVAQLISLDRSDPTGAISAGHHSVLSARLRPLGQAVVAVGALLLGLLLVLHTWRADRVHRLRVGAFLALKPPGTRAPDYGVALKALEAAAAADPGDADLQLELGQTYLDAHQAQLRQVRENLVPAQRNVLSVVAAAVGSAEPAAALTAVATGFEPIQSFGAQEPSLRNRKREWFEKLLIPGLEHMALARSLCPLLARPHMRFAAHADEIVRADPPAAYWARARRLSPADPSLWYYSGVQQIKDGQPEQAWASWRRSLELSSLHLDAIVDAAGPRLGDDPRQRAEGLMKAVLPDNPEQMLRAALRLDPNPTPDSPVRPLLLLGLDRLTARAEAPSARRYYLKARFHHLLGQVDDAIRDYDDAVRYDPNKVEWRQQFVELLVQEQKWEKAKQQLETLRLLIGTRNPQIENLYDRVKRQLEL
jgi:tetratricopeptide (TPR) repeat protein